MKKIPYLFVAVLAVLAILGVSASATDANDAATENAQTTLTGEYNWERGETQGELEAIFTPTGEATWDVSFNFDFRNDPHTYTGVAQGSLTDGELKGEVLNEDKNRTFTFEGMVEDGQFAGTHSEIGGRRGTRKTGTLTLAK